MGSVWGMGRGVQNLQLSFCWKFSRLFGTNGPLRISGFARESMNPENVPLVIWGLNRTAKGNSANFTGYQTQSSTRRPNYGRKVAKLPTCQGANTGLGHPAEFCFTPHPGQGRAEDGAPGHWHLGASAPIQLQRVGSGEQHVATGQRSSRQVVRVCMYSLHKYLYLRLQHIYIYIYIPHIYIYIYIYTCITCIYSMHTPAHAAINNRSSAVASHEHCLLVK